MKCFYHSADLDGMCAGAIVKYRYPECEMIGINYGQEFPFGSLAQDGKETVFMVDFCLQPFGNMEALAAQCNLIWIDHHAKGSLDEAEKREFDPYGIRRVGTAGCELTWEYLFMNPDPDLQQKSMPLAVKLLGRYDVWDHSDPRTLEFQYGMRQFEDTLPDNQGLWATLFQDSGHLVGQITYEGSLLLKYEMAQNAKFCKAYAFETTLRHPGKVLSLTDREPNAEYTAICANRGFTNSKLFDSVYDPAKHHLMITFVRLKPPAHKWTVSLYSTRDDVDCGAIAKAFDGGGHKGAAGFQCEQLPFEI